MGDAAETVAGAVSSSLSPCPEAGKARSAAATNGAAAKATTATKSAVRIDCAVPGKDSDPYCGSTVILPVAEHTGVLLIVPTSLEPRWLRSRTRRGADSTPLGVACRRLQPETEPRSHLQTGNTHWPPAATHGARLTELRTDRPRGVLLPQADSLLTDTKHPPGASTANNLRTAAKRPPGAGTTDCLPTDTRHPPGASTANS